MGHAEPSDIQRYLEEVFAGVVMSADFQDLKEELRAKLLVRVDELRDQGMAADASVQVAISDLGGLDGLIGAGQAATPGVPAGHAQATGGNKIGPKPGFVLGMVVMSVIFLASVLLFAVALGSQGSAAPAVLAGFAAAVLAGVITALSMRQETSRNHPVTVRRAVSYGTSSMAAVAGIAFISMAATAGPGMLVAGVFLVSGAAVGFIQPGIRRTDRKKP